MMTTEIRMPVMREAKGRWYWPGSASPATLLALAVFLAAVVFAYRYPAMKADEAVERLEAINELSAQSMQHTQEAISRLQVLIANQPEWLRQVVAEQTSNLQAQLSRVKPLSKDQALQKAAAQQEKYDQARQLIETSPFKGLTEQQVPLSIEGKLFLKALKVKRPSRFDYQRLSDAVLDALPVLKEGFQLQAQTENLAHRLDVQLNGDKAGSLGPAAAAALQAAESRGYEQKPDLQPPQAKPSAPIDTLSSAILKAQRTAELRDRQAELETQNRARQAERDAQREQQKAERLSVQRQRDTERQASLAVEATRKAEQNSERRLAAAKRQAEASAEAKQRECTASLIARARCAAQGYNPLTGTKN
jgi:hypothetical protein